MTATASMDRCDAMAETASLAGSMQRWLHVVSHTDPRYGGLSTAVPALAAAVAATAPVGGAAVQSVLAAFCRPGEAYSPMALDEEQVSFWPASRTSWWLDSELKTQFRAAVRAADGLHIHGLWEASTAVACATARRLGKPYVLSAHGMLEPWALEAKRRKKQIYAGLIERNNIRGAACLHALTAAEAAQYRRFGATGPVAVVPNAVAVPEDAHADLFLDRFPALRGKRLVVFLSRLHPKKGLELLLESWSQIAGAYPEAHLVIAGPDSEGMLARLTGMASARGIDSQVLFAGMLTGAMKWSALDAAECYVLPSFSEGLSMALLEAMGMGVPVIATHACNMPEITAADAGWEIEPAVEPLTAVLRDVLAHPREANWGRGRNGARLIAARYSPAVVAGQMAEVYRFVLGGPRPACVDLSEGEAR